jgi:hypothetical protein
VPYTGPTLTIGGELNKLAANVGLGRNMVGHRDSIHAGEESHLRGAFKGFSLTKFRRHDNHSVDRPHWTKVLGFRESATLSPVPRPQSPAQGADCLSLKRDQVLSYPAIHTATPAISHGKQRYSAALSEADDCQCFG